MRKMTTSQKNRQSKKVSNQSWVLWGPFLFSLFFLSQAFAESVSGTPIIVSASVPQGLTLELEIVDQLSGAQRPSLDFEELIRVGNELRSARFFKVFLKVNAAGDPMELTQIGTPLTRNSGPEAIPNGAYIVKPEYIEADNAGATQPTGSTLGAIGTAVGARLLFSDPAGSSRVITAIYTLSGDPNTGATDVIPLSQKGGSYSGTIQFTLTTA